ncbi:hypothetical protein ACFQXA_05980 [Nocardiopsis composta]
MSPTPLAETTPEAYVEEFYTRFTEDVPASAEGGAEAVVDRYHAPAPCRWATGSGSTARGRPPDHPLLLPKRGADLHRGLHDRRRRPGRPAPRLPAGHPHPAGEGGRPCPLASARPLSR